MRVIEKKTLRVELTRWVAPFPSPSQDIVPDLPLNYLSTSLMRIENSFFLNVFLWYFYFICVNIVPFI
jgi:hypothetical protein